MCQDVAETGTSLCADGASPTSFYASGAQAGVGSFGASGWSFGSSSGHSVILMSDPASPVGFVFVGADAYCFGGIFPACGSSGAGAMAFLPDGYVFTGVSLPDGAAYACIAAAGEFVCVPS